MLIEPKTVPIILKLCQHNREEPTPHSLAAHFLMKRTEGLLVLNCLLAMCTVQPPVQELSPADVCKIVERSTANVP